jgi:hypothetical protein
MSQEEKEFLEPLDDVYKEISRLNLRADSIEADQERAHEWSTEELRRRTSQDCVQFVSMPKPPGAITGIPPGW